MTEKYSAHYAISAAKIAYFPEIKGIFVPTNFSF